jgi:hypothetical protein
VYCANSRKQHGAVINCKHHVCSEKTFSKPTAIRVKSNRIHKENNMCAHSKQLIAVGNQNANTKKTTNYIWQTV